MKMGGKDNINWEQCRKDLEKNFPKIKGDLEKRIKPLFETTLDQNMDIYLMDRPPYIVISFGPVGSPQRKEYKRQRQALAEIISDIAQSYGLRPSPDFQKAGRGKWIPDPKAFTLKPNYKEYER